MMCPACGERSAAAWAVVNGYDHYRCAECHAIFVHPRPSDAVLGACYEAPEFYEKAEAQAARLSREADGRVRMLSRLADRFQLDRSLLDVGCASGIFLSAAREAGWLAEGVERSARLASTARARGLRVVGERLETFRAERPYGVVTAWEVIEHVSDPCGFLQDLRRTATPGGLIAISTPMADGLPARLLGPRFPMVSPPEHLCLLSRRAVRLLAGRIGLEIVRFRSFSNLGREQLASACQRYLLPAIPGPRLVRSALSTVLPAATVMLGLPKLMDRCGAGTEMEVVFRCPA